MAGSVLWCILFIITIPATGIITATIVASTTIILTTIWLKYKNYIYTKNQDSVIQKGPKIINI